LLLSFAIAYSEKLLKLRRCSASDVVFTIGWLGMICAAVETLGYTIADLIAVGGRPKTIEYLFAVLATW